VAAFFLGAITFLTDGKDLRVRTFLKVKIKRESFPGEGLLPAGLLDYARVIFDNPAIVFNPEPFVHPVNSPGILRLHNHRDKSEDAFGESSVVASICPGDHKRRGNPRSREESASRAAQDRGDGARSGKFELYIFGGGIARDSGCAHPLSPRLMEKRRGKSERASFPLCPLTGRC